jgi:VWFA-related protein
MQYLSGSMALGGKLADSRAALSCLLEQSRTEDLFALATFSFATARLQAPFTHDHATLGIAAEDWRPYGKTALHDAIATMPELHTAQGNRLKRAVVLVTDGADNASSLPPDTALGLLRRAKLPVYILYLNRAKTTNGAAAVAGVKGSDQLLRRLATMSGGRFFHLGNGFSIRQACRTISTELQHQYVLGFRIPGTGPSSHWRIRVDLGPGHGVPKPRLVHRQGYSGTTPP